MFRCAFGYDEFGEIMRRLSAHDVEGYLKSIRPPVPCGFFGDSHLRTFFCPDREVYGSFGVAPHIAYLSGATVLGFGRRTSSLSHFQKIEAFCNILHPSHVFFKFGQVDIELGYLYRILIKGEKISIHDHLDLLSDSYVSGISHLPKNITYVICGINLPTIVDVDEHSCAVKHFITENIHESQAADIYARYLPKYVMPYEERTKTAMLFNGMVSQKSEKIAKYVDMTGFFQDGDGLLKECHRQHDDIHYRISDELRRDVTCRILSLFFDRRA